ncbi:MAG: hypothetical protein KatS3mg082_1447 [Nitrospiraceae bacterium]|nr:MAG: hypothetical protein KatS3mg082_1447 [Nitrospiraceae bacterium]
MTVQSADDAGEALSINASNSKKNVPLKLTLYHKPKGAAQG